MWFLLICKCKTHLAAQKVPSDTLWIFKPCSKYREEAYSRPDTGRVKCRIHCIAYSSIDLNLTLGLLRNAHFISHSTIPPINYCEFEQKDWYQQRGSAILVVVDPDPLLARSNDGPPGTSKLVVTTLWYFHYSHHEHACETMCCASIQRICPRSVRRSCLPGGLGPDPDQAWMYSLCPTMEMLSASLGAITFTPVQEIYGMEKQRRDVHKMCAWSTCVLCYWR